MVTDKIFGMELKIFPSKQVVHLAIAMAGRLWITTIRTGAVASFFSKCPPCALDNLSKKSLRLAGLFKFLNIFYFFHCLQVPGHSPQPPNTKEVIALNSTVWNYKNVSRLSREDLIPSSMKLVLTLKVYFEDLFPSRWKPNKPWPAICIFSDLHVSREIPADHA